LTRLLQKSGRLLQPAAFALDWAIVDCPSIPDRALQPSALKTTLLLTTTTTTATTTAADPPAPATNTTTTSRRPALPSAPPPTLRLGLLARGLLIANV